MKDAAKKGINEGIEGAKNQPQPEPKSLLSFWNNKK